MGVGTLRSFMDNSHPSSFCSTVDIATLARQYTADTGKTPKMIVDGNNCMYAIHRKTKNESLMGGQLKECVDQIADFISAFRNIGVEVIFYFDGATPCANRAKWVTRREQLLQSVQRIFTHLKLREQNRPSRDNLRKLAVQPPLIGATSRFMVKYACAEGEQVQLRIAQEDCDLEIAALSMQLDCFAVLSGDTDFVILGLGRVLSVYDLDMATMKTRQYDGHKLSEHFSLSFKQLPLFASLVGGDVLPLALLNEYHERLTGVKIIYRSFYTNETSPRDNNMRVYKAVADFVHTTPESPQVLDMLPQIVKSHVQDIRVLDLLRKSVEYYSMSPAAAVKVPVQSTLPHQEWQRILTEMLKKHVNCEVPCQIRNIMTIQQFDSSTSLEDASCQRLPSAAAAFKGIRQRIYGILLHEMPTSGKCTVEEWCIYKNHPLSASHVDITPVPDKLHPGLMALWTDFDTPEIQDQRWQLFLKSVSPRIKSELMVELTPRYIVPTSVLFYIQHHVSGAGAALLLDWEVSAFLLTAVEVASMNSTHLRQIQTYSSPPPRAVECANIFARGVSTVHLLLAACGYNLAMYMPWHFYDGKLFLQNYLMMRDHSRQFNVRQRHNDTQVRDFQLMSNICK